MKSESQHEEREALIELIESLEEACVLLAEIEVRFGGVKILNEDCSGYHPDLTYGIAARAYGDIASAARRKFGLGPEKET
jgi:hypothetical protein